MNRGLLLFLALAAACAPRRIYEDPVLENGDRVRDPEPYIQEHREIAERERREIAARRDSLAALALAACNPATCDALARGELTLGMDETQVFAATRTTESAWTIRQAGPATVMVPRSLELAPRDATGEVAMVQLHDGRVTSYAYREPQGLRVVDSPRDATIAGRADALAEQLIREGDEFAARGAFDLALDRYDRAQILRADDPLIDYRIATVLDKQLRPIEALIQYKLFLHRLDLERLEAEGDVAAKIAEAIAQAHTRILVLEKQTQ
jgi:hypothetical protein